jgi:DegV family protein with EDD domain
VAVVADSASNLPPGLAPELGIQVVPLWLTFGDEQFRDGVDLAPGRFYERLAAGRESASTATPSAADFLDAYGRTGQREVVCITVAFTMSGVHHQAEAAAEGFDGTVVVIDSTNASMAEGFVALEAARLARDGASLEAVVERARAVAARTGLYATVNTFEFLQRSGRVNKLQAYAATVLDINPVFSFDHGDAAAVARPRTRRRALARIVDETVAALGGRRGHVAAIHAAAAGEARSTLDAIVERAKVVEQHVVDVTPVIGAHTGPGLVGAAFYGE